MKILRFEQNSDEWKAARAGLATASEFSSILAKGKGVTRESYLKRVAIERLTGKPLDSYKNGNMDRGHELEPLARAEYEIRFGVMVDTVGLIVHDHIQAAASPDGLVGDDGGIEIKCVIPTTQWDVWQEQCIPSEHFPQIQGNMWISGRQWWDFVSYCPEMPEHLQLFVQRLERNENYIRTLEGEVRRFLAEVEVKIARLPKANLVTLEEQLEASVRKAQA